jgi:DNA primase
MAGVQLPLYRLPQVLEQARQGSRVLVVEGEKACDALDRLNLFATTNAQGAGKWRPDHTDSLVGATVLAIADCDLAGRLHAIQLSGDLLHAGVRVLAPLDLEPLRNDGFDVVDYLAEVAATVRAVTPELDEAAVRGRLRDHLEKLLNRTRADSAELQRRLEFATFTANPAGHACIGCEACGQLRVHRVSHGFAYCPCGARREAP